ncbi:MAG: glycosyltransferase family 4 protein [Candidatus Omnitrophica bacterium]|nr:glycosyltransferase family 4 protein [Candidatus Omnitrophota bacterium]
MNVLTVGTIRDNMAKTKLQALVKLGEVEKVINIRDHPRVKPFHLIPNDLPKVEFIYPPYVIQRSLGRVIPKFVMTLMYMFKVRPKLIMSFSMVPNGLFCLFFSFFNVRWAHNLMCGKNEIILGPNHQNNRLKKIKKDSLPGKMIERFLKFSLRRADFIISMGSDSRRFLVNEVGINRNKILDITGSIDLKRFSAKKGFDKKRDYYDLITVSNLKTHKRIDRFITAVGILKSDYPDIKGIIIGEGNEMASLKEMVERLGLDKNIEFAGWSSSPETYLKKSKIFLLTSDTEGLSKATLEAMACGLPVICSDVGDMADIVKDGETGYLIRSLFASEFSGKAKRLLSNPDLRKRIGQSAQNFVLLNYSVEQERKKWEDLIYNVGLKR